MAAFRYIGDGTKLKLDWVPRHEGVSSWIQGEYHWALYDLFSVPKLKEHSITITPSNPRARSPIAVRKYPPFRLRAEATGRLFVARGEGRPDLVTLEELGFSRPPVGPLVPAIGGRPGWLERLEILPLRDMTPADRAKALEEDDARAALLATPEAFDRVAMLLVRKWRDPEEQRKRLRAFPRNIREDLAKYPPHVRRTEAWCCQGHADCKEFPELGRACFFQPRVARAARRRR